MKTEILDRLSVPVSPKDHIQGPSDAVSELVEYGDYECPFCGAAQPLVKAIQDSLGDDFCFAYRHFPLTTAHPHAEAAAQAAEAAGAQKRFWEMHDLLFENQDALALDDLAEYAAILGLDGAEVINEVMTGVYAPRVRENFVSGIKSGVNGTPTFFINGFRYDGPRELASMLAALTDQEGH